MYGAPNFVGGPFDSATFKIMNYLNAINSPDSVCNSSDQSAALQCYLKCIGILNVKWCLIDPFGYIRTTRIKGIGLSNNPKYSIYNSKPILEAWDKERTAFTNHFCCCLEIEDSDIIEDRILDATLGPHTGDENFKQYVSSVIDITRGSIEKPTLYKYNGVRHLDLNTSEVAIPVPKPEKVVMIIDESKDWLELLTEYISKLGYKVDAYDSFTDASEKLLASSDYDLVITELYSFELLKSKATPLNLLNFLSASKIPVMVLSVMGDKNLPENIRTAIMDYNVVDYISKAHLDKQRFVNSVKQILESQSTTKRTILLVTANPKTSSAFGFDVRIKRIRESLSLSKNRDNIIMYFQDYSIQQ